jgi:hypothetical protein
MPHTFNLQSKLDGDDEGGKRGHACIYELFPQLEGVVETHVTPG